MHWRPRLLALSTSLLVGACSPPMRSAPTSSTATSASRGSEELTGQSHPMDSKPAPNWWARNWKWLVPAGCLIGVAGVEGFIALIVGLVFGLIKSTTPYQQALARAQGVQGQRHAVCAGPPERRHLDLLHPDAPAQRRRWPHQPAAALALRAAQYSATGAA